MAEEYCRIKNQTLFSWLRFGEVKRTVLYLLVFFLIFSLFSCGGSGGGSDSGSVTLTSCSVTPVVFKKSAKAPITFSWQADTDAYSYYVDIYLSSDATLDSSDALIAHRVSYTSEDSFSLSPSNPEYQNLMDAYGGYYYLIFDAYTDEGHSVRFIPGFTLQNPWTVMVYMDGDNSLSDEVYTDMNELASVGSNGMVNVALQMDTQRDTTKRYFVKPYNPVLVEDLGELNMGDPATLEDFANWVFANYPADHYLLVLWNHGLGFENVPSTKDILWDDHPISGFSMSIPVLSSALSTISATLGRKIDIVGMDACLMSMLEVAYGIRNSADYMVASENLEPLDGWPYDRLLEYLESDPVNISPVELSGSIVDMFVNSYLASDEPTLSAVDLSKVDALTKDVSALADALISGMRFNPAVEIELKNTIYNKVQRFDESGNGSIDLNDSYVDLYSLASLIYSDSLMGSDIASKASTVMSDLGVCVIKSAYKGSDISGARGLSIWYPNSTVYAIYRDHYSQLSFAKDTDWFALLTQLAQ